MHEDPKSESTSIAMSLPELGLESDSMLRYARGFLLQPSKMRTPVALARWVTREIGDLTLHVDPRVPLDHASSEERQVWLIGDAFDPERGIFDRLASELARGELLDHLDRVAGRFALVVRWNDGRVEVYHDAMGSRSVFHGDGVVASHAGLVAEQLGTGLRDWVIPFITSRGYVRRDVKFLPGLDSPYEGVEQLTPNTRLSLPSQAVERYWPRKPLEPSTDELAVNTLVDHMRSLAGYLEARGARGVLGVSAGRDSRVALAGVSHLAPGLFTFVRGESNSVMSSTDSRVATQLAAAVGLPLELIEIPVPPHLNLAASKFAQEFRVNTGHVRGNSSGWIEHLWDKNPARDPEIFIRGFGGEVMRGFGGSRPLNSTSANALSNTYDVNAGSLYTRRAFARFREVTDWDESRFFGCSLSDIFYWEHRMGIWGSSSFTEADMALRGMPAYNSRNLFTSFWGLDSSVRRDGRHFRQAAAILSPVLSAIEYSS